jgi:hypothetical protein
MELIASGSFAGVSQFSFTSLPTQYNHLRLFFRMTSDSGNNQAIGVRVNNNDSNSYVARGFGMPHVGNWGIGGGGTTSQFFANYGGGRDLRGAITIYNYKNAASQVAIEGIVMGITWQDTYFAGQQQGGFNNNAAVTSFLLRELNNINFGAGSEYSLYGME